MNKVLVTGNIVKDIKLQKTNNGKSVVSNIIAVKSERKNENGDYETEFINFVAWGNQADYLQVYGKKGDRLELIGYWHNRRYDDASGLSRIISELIVESISLYSKKEDKAPTYDEAVKNAIKKDELPF